MIAVDDVVERATFGSLTQLERTFGGVAERNEVCADAVIRELEDAPREVLVGDRRVAAADAQVCCGEHHAHDGLADVEEGGLASVIEVGQDHRDGRSRTCDVSCALPDERELGELLGVRDDDEVPWLRVARRWRASAGFEDAVEVGGGERLRLGTLGRRGAS